MLNGSDVIIAQIALEQVQRRATHFGALAARDELDALARRICPLVKLTGQVLDGKEHGVIGEGGQAAMRHIDLGLAKNSGNALLEELVINALDIVAADCAQTLEPLDSKQRAKLRLQLLRLDIELGFLFDVNARNHSQASNYLVAYLPRDILHEWSMWYRLHNVSTMPKEPS